MGNSTSNSPEPEQSVTRLLNRLAAGDRSVEQLLVEQIYGELRRIARRRMRHERGNHTLQPTALANEAYIRLVHHPANNWAGRTHFFAAAAMMMRNILVDCAREHRAAKRGGGQLFVTLDDRIARGGPVTAKVLDLHEKLDRLAEFDPRQARVVDMHYFGGLTFEEIGEHLAISARTAKKDWEMARSWLLSELSS